jgi:hypothetical protein
MIHASYEKLIAEQSLIFNCSVIFISVNLSHFIIAINISALSKRNAPGLMYRMIYVLN